MLTYPYMKRETGGSEENYISIRCMNSESLSLSLSLLIEETSQIYALILTKKVFLLTNRLQYLPL